MFYFNRPAAAVIHILSHPFHTFQLVVQREIELGRFSSLPFTLISLIKNINLGHLVGHIYFASSIETLDKEGQKCGRKLSEWLEARQGILTIKDKNIMILVYKYMYLIFLQVPQHKISNSVFCESSITCVTCEPRKLPVLALK